MNINLSKWLAVIIFTTVTISVNTSAFSQSKQSPKLEIVYEKPVNSTEKKYAAWVKQSTGIPFILESVNQDFILKQNIHIVFGSEDGPLFDGQSMEILIPYTFLEEVELRFKKAKYAKDTGLSLKEATMNALLHTIYHELGHALIHQFDLPVLGKEEDAVDSLASILLIEYFKQGQEIVVTAADLFDLESEDIDSFEKQDFWDEHSLDIQRYYQTMCLVYGSAPKQYKHIKTEQKYPKEKAETCIDEYDLKHHGWITLLQPHMTELSK